jgi:hypothetical protein
MTYHNKSQITLIVIAPPDQVAEGDRIFKSHRAWMEATHHRTGEKALLSYNVSKGPELSNPGDPNSAPTDNTCFVQTEIYEGKDGVLDHFKQANENWGDVQAFFNGWRSAKSRRCLGVPSLIHSGHSFPFWRE